MGQPRDHQGRRPGPHHLAAGPPCPGLDLAHAVAGDGDDGRIRPRGRAGAAAARRAPGWWTCCGCRAVPVHYDDYTVFASPLARFRGRMRQRGWADRIVEIPGGETVVL